MNFALIPASSQCIFNDNFPKIIWSSYLHLQSTENLSHTNDSHPMRGSQSVCRTTKPCVVADRFHQIVPTEFEIKWMVFHCKFDRLKIHHSKTNTYNQNISNDNGIHLIGTNTGCFESCFACVRLQLCSAYIFQCASVGAESSAFCPKNENTLQMNKKYCDNFC